MFSLRMEENPHQTQSQKHYYSQWVSVIPRCISCCKSRASRIIVINLEHFSSFSLLLPVHLECELFLEGVVKGSELSGVEALLKADRCSLSGDESESFLVFFVGGGECSSDLISEASLFAMVFCHSKVH